MIYDNRLDSLAEYQKKDVGTPTRMCLITLTKSVFVIQICVLVGMAITTLVLYLYVLVEGTSAA